MRASALAILFWTLLIELLFDPRDHRLAVVFVTGFLIGLAVHAAARDLTEEPKLPKDRP